jgi:hypothetical protein
MYSGFPRARPLIRERGELTGQNRLQSAGTRWGQAPQGPRGQRMLAPSSWARRGVF